MNLMELLQLVDERLRPLAVGDESVLEAALEEVVTGPRPTGVAPNVEPRAILAGRLVGLEEECRILRERLHVQLTTVARLEIQAQVGPAHPRSVPVDPNEPA